MDGTRSSKKMHTIRAGDVIAFVMEILAYATFTLNWNEKASEDYHVHSGLPLRYMLKAVIMFHIFLFFWHNDKLYYHWAVIMFVVLVFSLEYSFVSL